jgi:hypothetical protein
MRLSLLTFCLLFSLAGWAQIPSDSILPKFDYEVRILTNEGIGKLFVEEIGGVANFRNDERALGLAFIKSKWISQRIKVGIGLAYETWNFGYFIPIFISSKYQFNAFKNSPFINIDVGYGAGRTGAIGFADKHVGGPMARSLVGYTLMDAKNTRTNLSVGCALQTSKVMYRDEDGVDLTEKNLFIFYNMFTANLGIEF